MTGRRLLVVDDEPDFGKIVATVGRGLGYEVEVTTTAKAFQQAFLRQVPDLICLDVVMPDMDGVQLVQWLAKREFRNKVVIMSGFNPIYAKMARTLGTAGGFEAVTLTKPIAIADLKKILS